jgi:transcriptional regulator with XRE-family HTH domain
MADVIKIHANKQPRRPHYIAEWAAKYGLRQKDLVKELGADKSTVSRWYRGASPSEDWQAKLSALFHCEPESLFRHPDDDWMSRFLKGRSQEEIERMKAMLEAAFPIRKRA